MSLIRLTPRSTHDVRCGYCHGESPTVRCEECGVHLHPECGSEGCPTLGCGEALYVTPLAQVRPDRLRRQRGWTHASVRERFVRAALGALFLACCGAVLGQGIARGGSTLHPHPLALVGFVLGLAGGATFMLWTEGALDAFRERFPTLYALGGSTLALGLRVTAAAAGLARRLERSRSIHARLPRRNTGRTGRGTRSQPPRS